MHNVQAKWQTVGRRTQLSLSFSLASVLAWVQTSQRRLRICICILQTIEKVVKVFHAALLCFHFITHTHTDRHICTHTHGYTLEGICYMMVFCVSPAYAMALSYRSHWLRLLFAILQLTLPFPHLLPPLLILRSSFGHTSSGVFRSFSTTFCTLSLFAGCGCLAFYERAVHMFTCPPVTLFHSLSISLPLPIYLSVRSSVLLSL